MKYQTLLSRNKDKKNSINLSSAELAQRVVMANICHNKVEYLNKTVSCGAGD